MIAARAFEAPLWAQQFPFFKSAVAMINPDAAVGEFGHGPTIGEEAKEHALLFAVGFLFSRPIEVLASSLSNKAAHDFSFPLRRAVMSAIMKQDTEYFDFNPASVLQQRLNKDTDELVENLLHVPRITLESVFRVIQRCVTLYYVAPAMLWACLAFNVPLFSIIVVATAAPLTHLLGTRDRANQNATAVTLELLQNIKTVRQFSMEREEVQGYGLNNLVRGVFESRIRVLEALTHTLRHTAHIAGEMWVIYVALQLALDGTTTTSQALVASTVGMWLQHDAKNVMLQIPKLIKVVKPVRRVASLLSVKPRIEKDPNAPKRDLRPESFEGHISFKNVTFSYPTERQKRVLNGLDFTAEPGQKIAFVGKAGCGKSTAMDLLQRFYNRTVRLRKCTCVCVSVCACTACVRVLCASCVCARIVCSTLLYPSLTMALIFALCTGRRDSDRWTFD
jgi:ABC-type multidrug transport system fused ATPase/permease subunit